MTRVYVGNLDSVITERDLKSEFDKYGTIQNIWVARRPPGYAFIDFEDHRDASEAIKYVDGLNGWRVEFSHNNKGSSGGGLHGAGPGGGGGGGGRGRGRLGGGGGGYDSKCYECGEPGHFARECRNRGGSRRYRSSRSRSRSPAYRRSPSYGRRSYSPRGDRRSPKRYNRRSPSPRGNSRSRSPAYKGRDQSPMNNNNNNNRHGEKEGRSISR